MLILHALSGKYRSGQKTCRSSSKSRGLYASVNETRNKRNQFFSWCGGKRGSRYYYSHNIELYSYNRGRL